MPRCGKKHTPIVTEAQQGKFGAELARRRAGKKPQMPGITTEELEEHLRESKGKKLRKRARARLRRARLNSARKRLD